MNLHEFAEVVEFNIKNNLKLSILGLGAPGLGKSQLIAQIAKKYGYRLIDLRLAQMSEVEIGGLIYPNDSKTRTVWLKPDFFPEPGEQKAILLLDEITSAPKRVQVAAYQLVLDRRIGKHVLPDDTVIIALGNREEDSGVYVQLAAPLANRFNIFNIDIDAKIWLDDYAYSDVSSKVINGKKTPFNPLVSGYIASKPDHLHTQSDNPDAMIFATPRSWERVSDILNADNGELSPVACRLIQGCLDPVTYSEFITLCRNNEEIQLSYDILSGKAYKMPTRRESNLFVIGSLRANLGVRLQDERAKEEIRQNKGSTTAGMRNACLYATKLPAELAGMCLNTISEIDKPLFLTFLRHNADIQQAFVQKCKFVLDLNADVEGEEKAEESNLSSQAKVEINDAELEKVELFGSKPAAQAVSVAASTGEDFPIF